MANCAATRNWVPPLGEDAGVQCTLLRRKQAVPECYCDRVSDNKWNAIDQCLGHFSANDDLPSTPRHP